MRRARKLLHVNQHNIKRNARTGSLDPVMTIKHRQSNTYGHNVDVVYDGKIIATFRYEPFHPLSCGAKVWFETRECELVPRGMTTEAGDVPECNLEEQC